MKVAFRCAALGLALAMTCGSVQALIIRGSQSCKEWTRERKATKIPFEKAWLLGYLSGLASGQNREFWGGPGTGLDRLENDYVYRRIDTFCALNQNKNVVHAADQLFKERTGLLETQK